MTRLIIFASFIVASLTVLTSFAAADTVAAINFESPSEDEEDRLEALPKAGALRLITRSQRVDAKTLFRRLYEARREG